MADCTHSRVSHEHHRGGRDECEDGARPKPHRVPLAEALLGPGPHKFPIKNWVAVAPATLKVPRYVACSGSRSPKVDACTNGRLCREKRPGCLRGVSALQNGIALLKPLAIRLRNAVRLRSCLHPRTGNRRAGGSALDGGMPAYLSRERVWRGRNPYQYASRRNESPIAQSRWPRWAIWRSSGFEIGTELDAPAGLKKAPTSTSCMC
jgi:hypothetical protein